MTSFGCTVELFQKQINKPFAALISSPESREISNPWCKGRFSDWCHTDWVPRLWTWPGHRPRQFSSFLHLSSKRKTSSKFCYFYWLHYLHLDNAAEGREGWAGSLNEDRKKKNDPFPDIPIPEIPQIDRRSEFRNPVWLPQLTHGYTADMLPTKPIPSWPSSKPDTSGARVFIGPPRFFSAPKEIPKEASDPPAKSACQRS